MRILIVEDDMASRKFMQRFLSEFGECDMAVDGLEAVDSILSSIKENKHYDFICLDIMMPKIDGIKVLKTLRDIETKNGIKVEDKAKVIMTTALNEQKTVMESYDVGCEAYALKPIDIKKFKEVMKKLNLI
jgi:two-component system chemotaxis response regulator CheY